MPFCLPKALGPSDRTLNTSEDTPLSMTSFTSWMALTAYRVGIRGFVAHVGATYWGNEMPASLGRFRDPKEA